MFILFICFVIVINIICFCEKNCYRPKDDDLATITTTICHNLHILQAHQEKEEDQYFGYLKVQEKLIVE